MTRLPGTGGRGSVCAERGGLEDGGAPPVADAKALFPPACVGLRSYVEGVARSTQTPVEMAALGAMCVASACVARTARVRGWGDHAEEAPLWGLILSEPGTRKSAVVSELLSPIVAWERDHAPEHAQRTLALEARAKRARALEERAARTDDPEQREELTRQAHEAHTEATAPAGTPAILSSEPTPEALLRLMHANGGTALVASAEADVVDIVLGRYSGGQRNFGVLLKGHAGDSIRSHRVSAGTALAIDRPRLSVCLVVQPASVRTLLSDPQARGRGLIARFAIVAPSDTVGGRDVRPEPVDDGDRQRWHTTLRALLDAQAGDEPVEITLDEYADDAYLRFQRQVEQALRDGGALAERREWGGKLCGLVLRCALTLHMLAHHPDTPGGKLGPRQERIGVDTMHSAIAWGRFLSRATAHATTLVEKGEARQERDTLLQWIRERGGETTVSSLMAGLRRYRSDNRGAVAACEAIVDDDLAHWEDTPRGRRLILNDPTHPAVSTSVGQRLTC